MTVYDPKEKSREERWRNEFRREEDPRQEIGLYVRALRLCVICGLLIVNAVYIKSCLKGSQHLPQYSPTGHTKVRGMLLCQYYGVSDFLSVYFVLFTGFRFSELMLFTVNHRSSIEPWAVSKTDPPLRAEGVVCTQYVYIWLDRSEYEWNQSAGFR